MADQQLSVEKSTEQAAVISMVNTFLHGLDLEYCKECVSQFRQQAHRQQGLAVLLPRYPQIGNDLLTTQAKALETLVNYVELLKGIDIMKEGLKVEREHMEEISKLFI